MSENLEYGRGYKDEEVMNWLEAQVEGIQKSSGTMPPWVIGAFEEATGRDKKEATATEKTSGHAEIKRPKKDDFFKFELIYIQVEDTIFTVIKDWLVVDESPFQAMFSLPEAVNPPVVAEGTEISNPIVLEQTSAASFKSFLRLLYGSRGTPLRTYDEWVGALELAMRWNFDETRKQAVDGLNSLLKRLGPAARIHAARRFSFGPWLRTGLIDLLATVHTKKLTPTVLTNAGRFPLDAITVANIFFACLELRDGLPEIKPSYCDRCSDEVWPPQPVPLGPCRSCQIKEQIVDRIFGVEIEGALNSEEL